MKICKSTVLPFNSLAIAKSFVNRASKMMMIVLGDDDRYWVVTPADGERLIRAGYEYAR